MLKKLNIPKGWEKGTVGDLARGIRGVTFSSEDILSSDEPTAVVLLRSNNIKDSRINFDEVYLLPSAEVSEDQIARAGDVAVCMSNGSKRLVGKAARLTAVELRRKVSVGAFCALFRPTSGADNNFVPYLFDTESYRRELDITLAGSAINNLKNSDIEGIKIPLPPLAEQRKIAEILRTWDEAIETAEAEHGSLVKQLNGLVQSLALRIPEGKAPNGWVDWQLGDLVVEVDRRVEWDDDMIYKLVSCARRSGGIFHREDKLGSEIAVKKMQEIRSGDFILSRMQVLHGGWAMVKPDFAGHHVSDMYMILEPRVDRLYMPYFDWISRTSWMRHLAYLASYGVHIEKMTFVPKLFLKSKVRIPDSIAEQKRIVEILDGFTQKVEISSALLELLRSQKRGLMQKLLTGEVRVAV